MQAQSVEILYNKEAAPGFYKLGLKWKTPSIRPGHFVMLRVSDGLDPLLRRPFGVYKVLEGKDTRGALKGTGVELLYQVVGKGTMILANRRAGEVLEVLGPLGNGFTYPKPKEKVIMIAGGMGIVPLYMLAWKLKSGTLLFGTRSKKESAVARDFRGFGGAIKLATEDGSTGRKGYVTELLKDEIAPDSVVFACGPVGMLKAASLIAHSSGAKCYVSLERAMACGIGVCLGCAVKAKTEKEKENRNYMMVCSEGPVFDSTDIDWERL